MKDKNKQKTIRHAGLLVLLFLFLPLTVIYAIIGCIAGKVMEEIEE